MTFFGCQSFKKSVKPSLWNHIVKDVKYAEF